MVWWCPSVRPGLRPSVRPSQFSALFSYMLWHIDLKFCVSLYFYARKHYISFYTPVFRRDVLWYGDVRPSGSPSVRPFVRPSQFSALFSYMLWHIDLKCCVSLYFYARKIKFECHQFPSLFAGVMLLFNFKLLQICSFLHFSPTCFDILSSNFVYDFVLMYHRASLSVVILLQFLLELCLFVNLEYSKYSFPHFSLTCFDILSCNFAYDFVLLYYRSSSSVVNLRQFW